MQRTFTEGDFIFTEHNLDTKEDEMQERRPTREKLQQQKGNNVDQKIQNLFKRNLNEQDNGDGGDGVFNKFVAFDVKPKGVQPSKRTDSVPSAAVSKAPSIPLKNNSEKSIIYAPFNSSFTDFDEDQPQLFKWPPEVLELMQPKRSKIIKFSKRCRDLNREYEENNNADLDNGVYNAFVNEQELEAERQQQEMMLAANTSDQNKLNTSVCSPSERHGPDGDRAKPGNNSAEGSPDRKKDGSNRPQNIVLNLDGLHGKD